MNIVWKQTLLALAFALYCPLHLDCEAKKNPSLFGPYYLIVEHINRCDTVTPENEFLVSDFDVVKLPDGEQEFQGYFNATTSLSITKGYIVVQAISEEVKDYNNWRQEISNPCRGIVFSYIINNFLHADKKCFIKKGFYTVNIKPNEIVHKYFPYTPYGRSIFTLEFFQKKVMLVCINFFVTIKPA